MENLSFLISVVSPPNDQRQISIPDLSSLEDSVTRSE